MEDHYRRYQRNPKGRQVTCVAGEDEMSDDHLENHCQKQQTNFSRKRQNKDVVREVKNEMCDDQLEDHFLKQHRRFPKSRQI